MHQLGYLTPAKSRIGRKDAEIHIPEGFTGALREHLVVMSALVLKQVMMFIQLFGPRLIISKAQLFIWKVVRLHFHLEGCCEDEGEVAYLRALLIHQQSCELAGNTALTKHSLAQECASQGHTWTPVSSLGRGNCGP